jgi:hypothetical protein
MIKNALDSAGDGKGMLEGGAGGRGVSMSFVRFKFPDERSTGHAFIE